MEKFKEWTFPSAEQPETAIDRDDILTNVMLYWLTGTGASSAHMYYDNMHSGTWHEEPATTLTGVAVFAEDIAIRRYAEYANNIVHWSEFDRGGHFAAMETPDLLVDDVRAFFRRFPLEAFSFREAVMTIRTIPEGYHTVTPFVISRDSAKLLDFVREAFGGEEIARVYNGDGLTIGHAEARIGDSVVMMFDAQEEWPDTLAFLRLYVGDCDAVYQQGAESRGYLSDREDEYALG